MMEHNWDDLICRISPAAPENLDDDLAALDPRTAKTGAINFPISAAENELPVEFATEEVVCFGVRVDEQTTDETTLAMTIAQMAAEKGAFPVVFSHVENCGLQRFGFRVERISGATPAEVAACEEQVKKFWNIVVII